MDICNLFKVHWWCRRAATALIRSPAWEPPYAVGLALKRPKKKKEGGDTGTHYYQKCQIAIGDPGVRINTSIKSEMMTQGRKAINLEVFPIEWWKQYTS